MTIKSSLINASHSAIVCGILLAACQGSAYAQADKIVMKLGHTLAPNNHYQLAALEFAKAVSAKTDGKIEVQVFPAVTAWR